MINYTSSRYVEIGTLHREPFNHMVIDDFFYKDFAEKLSEEFPDFDSPLWYDYNNPVEVKKTTNFWDRFPPNTYKAFWDLCQSKFYSLLGYKFGTQLYPDIGLNGGGWHIHGRGGKLNIHKDYSIHPKINMQRKLNIIIYLSKDWNKSWGGGLEFWSHDVETNAPKEKVKTIDVKFNRAVIFDTTQNSWHGLPEEINCPEGQYRKSLAMYYVQTPDSTAEDRHKAKYAPTEIQKSDDSVLDFIDKRTRDNWRDLCK